MTDTTLDRTVRLIEAAYGEDWYNADIVTDYGVGIAEPGYGDEDTVWVLGDWNPKRWVREGDAPLTNEESKPVRLASALEKYAGAELHWLDEWYRCENCYQIFRSQGDSYSWQMFGTVTEYGEVVCANCITFDDVEESYVNDPSKALTFDVDIEAEGFVQFNKDRYESGWYDGQTDDPKTILAQAHAQGWEEGIFVVSGVGQFDVHFDLWVR